ncbi:Pvc16 family protein [Sorangium sp. So ce1389]|uniref:Pvc16 family protein n=1 Tax=Sorangium sp. So ce1389 TaxID=3133336 RepID=UPI003F5E607F
MATFTNLYDATEVIKHVLETQIAPAPSSVIVGPPPDGAVTTEELRVSLLWINEQATHKNDGYIKNPDGTSSPPPATLSLFVLITGYGADLAQNAVGAHRLVGEALRVFHAAPIVELPIPALPSNSGRGKLSLALVPITPDIMEKLFSPLQIKHRPFLLYEVGPVQLVSKLAATPVSPVVAPGGIFLTGPSTATPPIIERLVPRTLAGGGYLRIDGAFASPVDTIWIGTKKFAVGSFDVLDATRAVGLTLPTAGPDAVPPGAHRVSVMSGKLGSEPSELRVVPAGTWSINGPKVLSVARGTPLKLDGQGLAAATLVYIWPEGGIYAPSDVHKVAPTVAPGSVEFIVPNVLPGAYRIAVELTLGPSVPLQFTPFVNVEITS